jgi:hypothetical protein
MKTWDEMIADAVREHETTDEIEVKRTIPLGDSIFTVEYVLDGQYNLTADVACDDSGAVVIGGSEPMDVTPAGW